MAIHKFSQTLVILTLLLLFIGGLVTSTGSGLAVPDWPLSYGSLTPPMIGGIRFEHTHRVVAATVGLLTLILTVWVGFTEKRPSVRWLSIGALAAVVLQGILGGMTVLYRLPAPVSITHACLGPTFFALTACLAVLLSPAWPREKGASFPEFEERELQSLSKAAVLLVFFQILLGAVVRHTGEFVSYHVLTAIFVFMLSGVLVAKSMNHFSGEPRIFRPALFLGFLVTAEFFLGIGAFVFTRIEGIQAATARIIFPTLHQTLGALILAVTAVLALRSCVTAVIARSPERATKQSLEIASPQKRGSQ